MAAAGVAIHVAARGKRFTALVAFKWFFSCVSANVDLEMCCLRKSSAAFVTFVPFAAKMAEQVGSKVTHKHKTLTAAVAH